MTVEHEQTKHALDRAPIPGVTVVIPARNAITTLTAQLQALAAEPPGLTFSVVVVDNGSVDGTGELAASFSSERFVIRVVHVDRPGINVARNAGVSVSDTEVVLLCDADDEVLPGWVSALASSVGQGHWAGGVVDYTGLNSARTRMQWGAPERSSPETPVPFYDRTFGCSCGFLRRMWEEVGGFDEALSGIGGDETEFFMRAYRTGWRQSWAPDAVVFYRLRPGARNMCRQRYRQGRNQVRMDQREGGSLGFAVPSAGPTVLALVKLALVSPCYLWRAPRRYEWLGAVSRHLGRLRGRVLDREAN